MTDDYVNRVRQEIDVYAEMQEIHDLPESFHYWSNGRLRLGIEDVFGVSSISAFYAQAIRESGRGRARVLSVGCGYGAQEMDVARELLREGFTDFEIVCADLSPALIGRFEADLPAELKPHIIPIVQDMNRFDLKGQFNCIMANQSLHHIMELENLFDFVRDRLTDDGIFATADMIGRNGHQRWPEAEAFVHALWPLLKDHQKIQRQLQRHEPRYVNHDCSTVGFEGIRSQDILSELLKRLHPKRFYATGGFIELLVEKSYGHNFDMDDAADRGFVEAAANLNDLLLDAGVIPPTMMFAHFSKQPCEERFYRQRSATRSLRRDEDRSWAAPMLTADIWPMLSATPGPTPSLLYRALRRIGRPVIRWLR